MRLASDKNVPRVSLRDTAQVLLGTLSKISHSASWGGFSGGEDLLNLGFYNFI